MQLVSYTAALSEQFLALGRAMHAESAFKNDPWDETKLTALAERPGVFCLGALDADGQMVAFFMGGVFNQFFGPGLIGQDMAIFVKPEHRGGMYFVRMLKVFEAWCKDSGAHSCSVSQNTGVDIERTREVFARLGYATVGFNTRKEL